jgi:hypothetical protein
MATYEVNITAYVESFEIVEADSEDEAVRLAHQLFSGVFGVYNTETKEIDTFTDVVAYEPKEITK